MQAHRWGFGGVSTGVLLVGWVVFGCSRSDPPPPPPSPLAQPTSGNPAQPAPTCPDVATLVTGTWSGPNNVTEEWRDGGAYVINGRVGTFRWIAPGRAFIEVPGTELHHEYWVGLPSANELIAIDPNRVGTLYSRTTPSPNVDARCFDLTTRIVGTWIGGQYAETYNADGTYRVNDVTGRWSFTSPGHLRLENSQGPASDYLYAIVSPTQALAVNLPPLRPEGTIYTRQP
jgi:hypothetical protein